MVMSVRRLSRRFRRHVGGDIGTSLFESLPFGGIGLLYLADELERLRMPSAKALITIKARRLHSLLVCVSDANND